MDETTKLECDIRETLIDTRKMLGAKLEDRTAAMELLKRLLFLADAAFDAGFPLSEQYLDNNADELERRIGLLSEI